MILQIDDREVEVEAIRPELHIDEVEENGVWKLTGHKWLPLNIKLDSAWDGTKNVKLITEAEEWLLKDATYSNQAIHFIGVEFKSNV